MYIYFLFLRREKVSLSSLVSDELLDLIKIHAGLKSDNFSCENDVTPICIETLKSICNLTYNSRDIAERCYKKGVIEEILKRMSKPK